MYPVVMFQAKCLSVAEFIFQVGPLRARGDVMSMIVQVLLAACRVLTFPVVTFFNCVRPFSVRSACRRA